MAVLLSLALPGPAPCDTPGSRRAGFPRAARFQFDSGVEVCPEERAVRRAVVRRLGHDPFDESARLLLSVRIAEDAGELEGTVELVDDRGQLLGRRRVFAPAGECVELARALVLAISIVLDPPQAALRLPSPARPSPPPTAVAGDVGGHVAMGAAPATAVGITGGVAGRRNDRSLGFEARVDLPSEEETSGGRVRTLAAVGALSFCMHWRMLGGCGLAGAGVIRASGEGFEDSAAATRPVVHAGPRIALAFPLTGPLSIVAHADGLVALLQTNLRVGDRLIWATPVFSGVVGVRLRARLW